MQFRIEYTLCIYDTEKWTNLYKAVLMILKTTNLLHATEAGREFSLG